MEELNHTKKADLINELQAVLRQERDGYEYALNAHKAALLAAQNDVTRLRRERDEARKALLDQANAMGLMARNWPTAATPSTTDTDEVPY